MPCTPNLGDGFAPLDDAGWFTSLPSSTGITIELDPNHFRLFVDGGAGGVNNALAYLYGHGGSPGSLFTGTAPQQLTPCGGAFTVSFDYSLTLVNASATQGFCQAVVSIMKVWATELAPLDYKTLLITGANASDSGSHVFTVPVGAVGEDEFVTMRFEAWAAPMALGAGKSGEIVLENFAVALI